MRETFASLEREVRGSPLVDRGLLEKLLHGVPVEALHHHERRLAVDASDLEDSNDVLARETHRRLRLAKEARHALRIVAVEEHLQGNRGPRALVLHGEDRAIPALAEQALHAVSPGEKLAVFQFRGRAGHRFQNTIRRSPCRRGRTIPTCGRPQSFSCSASRWPPRTRSPTKI